MEAQICRERASLAGKREAGEGTLAWGGAGEGRAKQGQPAPGQERGRAGVLLVGTADCCCSSAGTLTSPGQSQPQERTVFVCGGFRHTQLCFPQSP